MHGLSSWVRAAALGAGLMACGGRTGLDKPGDACLGISADCDGDAANGCEADLDTNRERCGACGDACEAGLFCSGGECVEGRRIVQVETRTGAQYARTADGRIFAWGTNDFGQVDPASSEPSIYTPRLVQLPVPSAEVTTSWVKTCSRGVDGSVWCWGTGVGEPPFEVDDLAGVTKLMGDQGGFCAFDAYRGQKCWSSASNDIGIGTGEGADSVRMDVPYEMKALPRPLSFLLTKAAAVEGGSVLTWGPWTHTGRDTPYGELSAEIDSISGPRDVVRIDSGDYALCATERDGRVFCWGDVFRSGEISLVTPVFEEGPYKRAAVGAFVCALRTDGQLLCRGPDGPIFEIDGIADVSSGTAHVCLVTFDGRVSCRGQNGSGVLGVDPALLPQASELMEVAIPND